METRMVDLDGPLHVADFGGEGTPIVLVHGLGGSHVNWISVGADLAEYGRVVALDLPGFGRSPLDGRSSAVFANRDLIARFLKEQCDEPAVLIGNSMGGLIALLVAARYPDLVRAYVGVSSALPRRLLKGFELKIAALFGVYMIPGLAERAMKWRYERLGYERVLEQVLDICFVDPSRISDEARKAHDELARERYEEMPWTYEAFTEAVRSLIPLLFAGKKMQEVVERVEVPGLIIQGDGDRLMPLRSARRVAEWRPDWSFEVFEDVGHVPMLEAPDRFVEFVGGWISGLEAGAAARDQETVEN
jgi:pimeloyl-ACP methyl ester carboxylesterase